MNILAIGAHPDDLEIACAGTLLKFIKRGDKVIMCNVANGNMGHAIIKPSELREIRRQEARKSAKIARAEHITCDIGDLLVEYSIEQKNKVIEVIRYAKPDLIITHPPEDYMPDHVNVSKLVFDASFGASVPHYHKGEAVGVVPIYYMDTLAGVNFLPTEYVDISKEIETKLDMLACHDSQISWMKEHDNIDFIDFVRTCAKYRGLQCNSTYAEAFKQCLTWPRIGTKRLLP